MVQTGQVITDGAHHRVVNNILWTVGELEMDQTTQLPEIVVQYLYKYTSWPLTLPMIEDF